MVRMFRIVSELQRIKIQEALFIQGKLLITPYWGCFGGWNTSPKTLMSPWWLKMIWLKQRKGHLQQLGSWKSCCSPNAANVSRKIRGQKSRLCCDKDHTENNIPKIWKVKHTTFNNIVSACFNSRGDSLKPLKDTEIPSVLMDCISMSMNYESVSMFTQSQLKLNRTHLLCSLCQILMN